MEGDRINFSDPFGLCGKKGGPPCPDDKPIERVTKDIGAAKAFLAATTRVGAAVEFADTFGDIAGQLTVRFGPPIRELITDLGALQQTWENKATGMWHVLRGIDSHALTPGGPDIPHINYEQHVPRPGNPSRRQIINDVHLDSKGNPIPPI